MGVKEDEARGCEVGLFEVSGRRLPHLQSTLIDDPRLERAQRSGFACFKVWIFLDYMRHFFGWPIYACFATLESFSRNSLVVAPWSPPGTPSTDESE